MKIICLATNEIGEVSDAIGNDIDLLKSMGYAQHSLTEIPLFCQQNLTNEINTDTEASAKANTETNRSPFDLDANDQANNAVKVPIKRTIKKRVNKPQKEKDHAS